jgi:hypothetical protein
VKSHWPIPKLIWCWSCLQLGGAISVSSGALSLRHVAISLTEALGHGGAVSLSGATASIIHSTFVNCSAGTSGGAIWAGNSTFDIGFSAFDSNTVAEGGLGDGLYYASGPSGVSSSVMKTIVRGTSFQSHLGTSTVFYMHAPMNWECEVGQWMATTDDVIGDFEGCAHLCVPGTNWTGPFHRKAWCGGMCSPGYYCAERALPKPCPRGTWMPTEGAPSLQSCLSCKRNATNLLPFSPLTLSHPHTLLHPHSHTRCTAVPPAASCLWID